MRRMMISIQVEFKLLFIGLGFALLGAILSSFGVKAQLLSSSKLPIKVRNISMKEFVGLSSKQHQLIGTSFDASGELAEIDENELIQLLALLYARIRVTRYQLEEYLKKLPQLERTKLFNNEEERNKIRMKFEADDESMLEWLHKRKQSFPSLKGANFELLDKIPNGTINVCLDGPKILVLPNVSDILYCYTRNQWIEKLWGDLRNSTYRYYPIIMVNILIFLIGTTGNIFVCLSVYRNHQLRSVTNYFIVNLAFADLFVIIICLPATQVWDFSLTWFFGTIPCKLIMFLQDVSVSVSVLTLTAISLDRYYAICHPLKFKSNLNQTKRVIALIWLVSLAIMTPDLIYLSAQSSRELEEAGIDTVLYSDCNYNWSESASKTFQFVKTIILYLLPFILMFWAHYTIMRTLNLASASASSSTSRANTFIIADLPNLELPLTKQQASSHESSYARKSNKQIHFHDDSDDNGEEEKENENNNNNNHIVRIIPNQESEIKVESHADCNSMKTTTITSNNHQDVNSTHYTRSQDVVKSASLKLALNSNLSTQLLVTMHNKSKLESRRKAAKMLTAIVIIFSICYLPVHLINFIRLFRHDIPQNDITSGLSMLAHCICYLHSAINPIIYNHMNSVFRAEFKKFLLSCFLFWRRQPDETKFNSIICRCSSSNGQNHQTIQMDTRNTTTECTSPKYDRPDTACSELE